MTKEEIITELNHRATQKYLVYLALQEIMLDYYEDVTMLKAFDGDLKTKHKNMINALKRKSTEAFRFLENYDGGEATIKQFHSFVKFHEFLHKSIDKGGDNYFRLMNDIEQVLVKHGFEI